MSKTPEELAEEYTRDWWGNLPEAEGMRKSARENFLAGYKAAQEHAHAALEEAEVRMEEIKDQLAGVSKMMPQWISVKDRLPEEDVEVLFFSPKTEYNCYFVGYKPKKDAYVDPESNALMLRTIEKYYTHWMPLPEPPKEEK